MTLHGIEEAGKLAGRYGLQKTPQLAMHAFWDRQRSLAYTLFTETRCLKAMADRGLKLTTREVD